VLAGITEGTPTNVDGPEWRSVTVGTVAPGGTPVRLDGYDGGALKYTGRGVASVTGRMGSPSGPIDTRFC
jgi:hypothetical protein